MKLDNNLAVIDVVKKNITDKTGIFDEVYEPFIIQFLLEVEKILNHLRVRMNGIDFNLDKIYGSLAESYKMSLISICQKSLIAEITKSRDMLLGKTKEDRYEYFVNVYMKNNFQQVFGEDSQLLKLVFQKKDSLILSLGEFFQNLSRDVKYLKELTGEGVYQISDISIGDGDTHNGGRSVYILTVNEDKKIVYKPHSLINDEIYESIIQFVNNENKLKLKLQHVKVLNRKKYGWQKFVKKESCVNQDELCNYMYRFGCHVFLCYLLNCTDMHFENIMASKDVPYLVDTETLFTNTYSFGGIKWNAGNHFEKALNESVFASALLPVNVAGIAEEKQKVDLSGLAGGVCETFIEADVVTNKGTSDIGYEHVKVRIDDKLNINNSVLLNGKKVDLEPYLKYLLIGFEDCYNLFLETDNIKEITENTILLQGEYRQVLRNTKLYYKYMDASYHPCYLKKYNGRDTVFQKLCGSKILSNGHAEIIKSECRQMKNGDVPYFYAKYSSKHLFSQNEIVVRDFYAKTLKEIFEERILALSEQDLKRQIYFIKCAVYSTYQRSHTIKFPLESKDSFEEVLVYILENHGISDGNEKKEFYNIVLQNGRYSLGKLQPTLYEGIGMAVCVLGMYKASGNRKMLEVFRSMDFNNDISLRDIYKYNKTLGMFDGCGAYIYLSYNLAAVTREENDKKKFYEYLSFYEDVELDDYESMDIVSGCAGIVLFAAHIIEKNGDKKIKKVCSRFADRMYHAYMGGSLPFRTGFAHGYAGIGAAFMKAAKVLEDSRYYEAGIRLLKTENTYYQKESNNWIDLREHKESMTAWCYGAAGILMSRICAYQNSRQEDREMLIYDIQKSYLKLLKAEEWMEYEDILCHGTIGNIDALRYYRNYDTNGQEYLELEHSVEQKMMRHGIKSVNTLNVHNIGFMDGLSGVLYHELRKRNNEMPCMLMLESF